MNNQTAVFKKLETLEKEFQKLKIETFFTLPKKMRRAIYPEKSLRRAIRDLRKTIWQEGYDKKV